jgi:lambda family phage tail tape measure protein
MSDVVGKATLEVGADVSGVKAGFAEAERSIIGLERTSNTAGRNTARNVRSVGDAAADAAARTEAASRRFLQSLERQADRAGKTAAEYAAFRAQQLGVAEAAAPMIERLRAAETQFQDVGMSARQTAAAMRMVPAQMTDIVTQLAGGQNPLLILTQQGGQLKDMFGGIGPAIRGFGTYVAGLINPFTLAGAAAGIFALGIYKGSQESVAFTKALISTGNYAGKTADQLQSTAARVSESVGTHAAAAEALTKLASSGRIAAEQYGGLTSAALTWQKATGAAVDDTIAQFVRLGEEPTKASAQLNEQYHYLTASVYEQIRALEEQGRKDEAAALAQQTYARALQSRGEEIRASLGFLERAWDTVSGAAKKAWDNMLGLGRAATLDDIRSKMVAVQNQIASIESGNAFGNNANGAAFGGRSGAALTQLRRQLADLQAQAAPLEAASVKAAADANRQRQDDERIAARDRLAAQAKATRSRAEQRREEIEQLKRDAATVGLAAEEYNRRVAAIEDKYKDPKGPRGKAYTEDAGTRYLDQLRQTEASLRAQLADTDKLTAAEKARVEFEQQLADIKTKKVLTADQKSLLARQAEIRAQLDLNVAAQNAVESKKAETKELERQAKLLKEAQTQAEGVNVRIREGAAARAEQYDRQLSVFGLGSQAQEQMNSQRAVYREFDRIRTDWIKTMSDKGLVGTDVYTDQINRIRDAQQAALEQVGQYYAELRTKQSDWKYGAMAAMSDYRDYAANVADQTGRLFGGMFQGLEDSVVNFAMTGKASFGDFAKAVIADLARIQARAAISGLAQMGIQLVGSLFAAGAGTASTGGSAWSGFSTGPATTGYTGTTATGTFGNGLSGVFVSGARAAGGPVAGGSTYLVGERGPELFTPNRSGSIVPNHALGGGDINVSTQVVVDSSGAQSQSTSDSDLGKQLGNMVNAAVTEQISRQMRQGGLLWKMRNGQA